MFGKYALPSDVLIPDSITGSDDAEEYPATHAITLTSLRPAKLDSTSGSWVLTYSEAVEIGALHLPYANFDAGLAVTLDPDGGTPITITCPGPWENGWFPGIFKEFTPQSDTTWTLNVSGTNSQNLQVFKILPYASLRDLENDVRWGVVEDEVQGDIWHETEGGAVSVDEIWGPRRSFSGEFALRDQDVAALLTLHRSVKQRIRPWTLIPDVDVNDAWYVRFSDRIRSQTRETINHNICPFRVTEVSRGLPWP